MKKTILTFGVLFAVICGTLAFAASGAGTTVNVATAASSDPSSEDEAPSYGVSIGTVDVQGSYYYVYYLPDNLRIGFEVSSQSASVIYIYYSDGEYIYLSGDKDISVTIPDSIRTVDYNGVERTYPVTEIRNYYYYNNYNKISYPYPTNLKTLTIPSTVERVSSSDLSDPLDKNIESIYMLGDAYQTSSNVNAQKVYVCDKTCLNSYLTNDKFNSVELLPYGWEFKTATVNVKRNGEFAETYLSQNDYDWSAVQNLKVTGKVNEIDLKAICKLTSLMKLDLSETTITDIPDNYMKNRGLEDIKLPGTVINIGESAFYRCSRLKSITLNGVQTINNSAFEECVSLDEIDLSTVKYIGYSAFSGCSSIKNISLDSALAIGFMDLNNTYNNKGESFLNCTSLGEVTLGKNLKRIGVSSFKYTAIKSVEIPEGVELIPTEAFYGCHKLESVTFPGSLTTIQDNSFEYCTSLANIDIPKGVTEIGKEVFWGCESMKKAVLPVTLKTIGKYAFYGTGIQEMVCYASLPPIASYFIGGSNIDMNRACLYVPPFSKPAYRNDEVWSVFNIMRPIESPLEEIYIDRPMSTEIDEDVSNVISDSTKIEMAWNNYTTTDDYGYSSTSLYVGQLTTYGDSTLSVGEFNISGRLAQRNNSYNTRFPTLINNLDKMRANNVTLDMTLVNKSVGEWHFISVPFDVRISDIVTSKNTYWVVRRYDSAARAAGEGLPTWVKMTDNDIMEAGKGYIISATGGERVYDNYSGAYVQETRFTFSSGNTISKNNVFRSTDVIVPLKEYNSEFAHNRSWNLIGNPFPCFYNTSYIGDDFNSPITIWNGSAYIAYSPVDDDLVLLPYESFFVQCPLDVTEIVFKEEGRMHFNEVKNIYYASPADNKPITVDERNVFNFEVSNENCSDRARIVFNKDASMEYELGRDASKFFAEDSKSAQIYVASDVNYSICERPVNEGLATLGFISTKEEEYTLSLSGRFSPEWNVILTDNVTGSSVDLTKNDYQFISTESDSVNRFNVKFQIGESSGIESVIAFFGEESIVTVTSINGTIVYTGRLSDVTVPSAGVYIVSDGQESRKTVLM